MSNDTSMVSQEEVYLNGKHSSKNGIKTNGHVNGASTASYSSNDDEDEVPLSQSALVPSSSRSRKRKIAYESSSEDEKPLASSQPKSAAVPMPGALQATAVHSATNGKSRNNISKAEIDEDIGDRKRRISSKPPKKKVKKEVNDSDPDFWDEEGTAKKAPAKRKRQVKKEDTSDDESDTPRKKVASKKTKAKAEPLSDDENCRKKVTKKEKTKAELPQSPKKGKKKKDDEEEAEEVFKWWEQDAEGDGTEKWKTLEHNGVIFPPPYEPLPSHVKMLYRGKPVDLPPESEEVAGFFGAMLETDHAKDATFIKNFFQDWKGVLQKHPPRDGTKIAKFDLCDFRPLFEYFESEKAKKKAMTSAEKKAAKKSKDEMEAPYTTCLLDGRKEKVGNFRVEPPGLFRGRGEHPRKGALKLRVHPRDITINIGKDAIVPKPNVPGQWKSVIHDNTVTWLANWTENVNGNYKYVFLAAGSSLKGQSDMSKFEKARELKNHVERIRADYQADLKSKITADRMRATAMYFIDKLALRAGNEKGEDEADTVGCCSLRCEHVTLESPNFLIFDFLGKDSIRYYNKVEVEPQIFKNIIIFKKNNNDDDPLFDRVNTSGLNKHLTNYMSGLTAKVFRTYNASITFQRLLDEQDLSKASLQEKLNAYNAANRDVAILCNHQRAVPKTHDQSMEKMRYKIRGLKYDRMKLRHALFAADSKFKKNAKYSGDESDIDDEFVEAYEEGLEAKEVEKVEKKFAKENEKLQEENKLPQEDSILKGKIKDIEAEFKRLAKERGTGKAELKRDKPVEKIEEAIDKLDERIKTAKLQMLDRDEGKQVALGTSKINYLDPRITVAWCKTHNVPVEKMFTKTLITKFPWAMEAEEDWKF